ncbi:hypothetical protein LINGRAHAP2_LOCUS29667 [Linum grandiflorum]
MALSSIFFFFFLMIFSSPTSISIAMAQGRAPHGLVYQTPLAFSPSAVDFFHPNRQDPNMAVVMNPCQESSGCSPLPLAAQMAVQDQTKVSSSMSQSGGNGNGFGGGNIVGIVLGVSFLVFLTL